MEATEATAVETAESASVHTSPAAKAVRSRGPAAKSALVTKTAEGAGSSCPVVVACPGVRVRKVIAAEILDASIDVSIEVDGVSAHIPVEFIPVEFIPVEAVAVRMVPAVETIGVVSTDVSAMPGRIAVERGVVVRYRATCPMSGTGDKPTGFE